MKGNEASNSQQEESKKTNKKGEAGVLSMDSVVSDCLEKLPWMQALANKDTNTAKMVKGGCSVFNKHQ